jgi:cyclophilin family peptidyl-prolyl cis-trans isomerase
MRRTNILQFGSKGTGWYSKYLAEGQEGFQKYKAPTAFDWTKSVVKRPTATFSIKVDKEILGKIKFELASDIVPKTVENFRLLCKNEGVKFKGYSGSKFHYVKKNVAIIGGDIENHDGTGSHSASSSRFIEDENFIIPHTHRGLLSMASVGRNTNGSQFYIDLAPAPHLNGRCMVFGRVVEGMEHIDAIEKMFTVRFSPVKEVVIDSCEYNDAAN